MKKTSKISFYFVILRYNFKAKAELQQVGIFFALNFLPWDFLLIKKSEIEKTKTVQLLKLIWN